MDKIITLLPKRLLGFATLFLFSNILYGQAPYCTPTYDRPCNAGDGFGVYISQFTLKKGTSTLLSDATGCNSTVAPFSYINFTATTPSVIKGSTYSFDIAFMVEGFGATDAGYAIWIDFNNNNTFESSEQVASGLTAGTGTFTIPLTTTTGNHRMRVRSRKNSDSGFPAAALPTAPCDGLYDMGDAHDYTLNVISCPTITDSLTVLRMVTCIAGNNGELHLVGKGGVAPYSFTLGAISGDVTNTTGIFTGLVPKDYRYTITDANGCAATFIKTLDAPTDFSLLNSAAFPTASWQASDISAGAGSYTYLPDITALPALKPNGDSLALYNMGNSNAMSKYITMGFPFKIDNSYYDSLTIAEDGVVSFNRNINLTNINGNQWYENVFYRGSGTYTDPVVGDCQCDTAYLTNALPFIAPFRDDLQPNGSGPVKSQINYELSGAAPNRIFRVEWRNMRWHRVCGAQRDNSISIQLELHETTNKVIFRYKPETNLKLNNCGGDGLGDFSAVNGYNYSVGLFGRRIGLTNYLAVNPDSAALFTNNKVKVNNMNFPAAIGSTTGKHYQFLPPTTSPSACANPLSIVSVEATCSSGSDGTITIMATGGVRQSNRYFFSKDGGKTYVFGSADAVSGVATQIFTGLAAGTYRIAVKDLQGSFVIQTVEVPNARASGTITQIISCNGAADGKIQFNWAKSSATYDLQYQKTGGTLQSFTGLTDTFKLFTGLSAGTYNVTVTFPDIGCTATTSTVLADPSVLTLTPSITQPACPANATSATSTKSGSATVTVSGGTSPYTFTLPMGLTASSSTPTSRTFASLAAGTYTITVTDAGNCQTSTNVTVSNPTDYAVNVTATTNPSCSGGTNGAATFNVTGGSTATFNSIIFSSSPTQTFSNIAKGANVNPTGLAAGSYNVSVTEGSCTFNQSSVVTLNAPSAVTFTSFAQMPPTCFGGSDGTLTLVVSGGTSPYMYSIDNGMNYQASSLFTGLMSGSYTLKAKDANNCLSVTTPTVSVATPTAVTIFSISKNNVSCRGASTGLIQVGSTGGTSPYEYSKDNGVNFQTSNQFLNLPAGSYAIKVKDSKGCISTTTTVSVTEPETAVSFITTTIDAKCNGGSDGKITVTASGGTGSLQFSKDGGTSYSAGTSPFDFTSLSVAGSPYSIRIKDANGCESTTSSVSIGQPTPLSITQVSKQDKDCTHPTGSVGFTASGGTGTLSFNIGTGAQSTGAFTNLAANNYTLTVTDGNNCTKTQAFMIADNGTLPTAPSTMPNKIICKNESVTLTATGGNGTGYNFYDRDPSVSGAILLRNNASSYTFTLAANTTIFITTVNSLCESAPISTTITAFDCAKIGDPCVCKNNATTLINGQFNEVVEVSAPTGQTWSVTAVTNLFSMSSAAPPAAPTLISIGTTMTYDALSATYKLNGIHVDGVGYSVTVSNGLGTTLGISNQCWYPNPTFAIAPTFCSNAPSVTLSGSATLGNSATAATGTGSFTIDNVAAMAFNPAAQSIGNHTVTYAFDAADNVPTAAHPGCIQSVDQSVLVNQAPSVSSIIPTSPLCPSGSNGSIDLTVTGGTATKTYIWNRTSGGFSASTEDITGLTAGTYNVTVTNTVSNTCSTTASATVIDGVDAMPPTIICPANMVVQLGSGECRAAVTFNATATDNCTASPLVVQTLGLPSGSLFGIGTYNIGFRATDAALNMSNCTFSITVNENIPTGTLTCLAQVNVAIDEDCRTKILADYLLQGTGYGCFEKYIVELSTLGGTILPDDYVTAQHVGKTLKASVMYPNSTNKCWGYITIQDNIAPTITCPAPVAVLCSQVPFAGTPPMSLTGQPTVVKECSLPTTVSFNDQFFDVPCGSNLTMPPAGFPVDVVFTSWLAQNLNRIIVRTFTVKDRGGLATVCKQAIYVQNVSLFSITRTTNKILSCANSRTAPTDTIVNGTTVLGTGVPTYADGTAFTSAACKISAGYADTRVQNATGFIINRNWVVTDVCRGQMVMWTQLIEVRDAAPVLTLQPNVTVQIPSARRIDVTASSFITSLTDDCTVPNRLVIGIRKAGTGMGFPTTSTLTFACGDQGNYTIEVWVRDEAGNITTKTIPLSIKDDGGNCTAPSILGKVQRENGSDVPTKITLFNANNDSINGTLGATYNFANLLPNVAYKVVPTRPNNDWYNGVTMFDVALMARHVLGVSEFASPYVIIGGDVNRDNDIDGIDMLLTQRLILRIIDRFPNNNSWRFIPKNYRFVDPTAPFDANLPETLTISSLNGTIGNGDFVAIKVGDVNLSSGTAIIRGSIKPFELSVEDKVLKKNTTYTIPIKLSPFQKDYKGQNVSALQFALNVDKNAVLLDNIGKGDLPNCSENNIGLFKNEGTITAAWSRSPSQRFVENDSFTLLNLTIKATKNARLSEILSLNPIFTEGVAYDEIGNGAPIKLSFGNRKTEMATATLLPNRPNPFSEQTTIAFILPESGVAKLTITDLLGRVVSTTEKAFVKGLNEVVFNASDTPSVSSGVLVVRLQTGSQVLEQKILLSR